MIPITVYNWLTLLGVPGMLAALIGFIRMQIVQNRAVKNGMQAILRERLLWDWDMVENNSFILWKKRNLRQLLTLLSMP